MNKLLYLRKTQMRIQYCSDLHLEFDQNNLYIERNPLTVIGDILVLAGDVVPLDDKFLNNNFFRFITDNYKKVFWVPGNHEFYYKDISEYSKSYHIRLSEKLSIVHNTEVQYENIRLIFSTLWSNISTTYQKIIETSVSDFLCISNKNKKFKTSDFNRLHNESLEFLKNTVKNATEKTVIVTHHLPSSLCNSPAFAKSIINEAFCVDLTNFIENCNAGFWIYGHSHFNQNPLFLGNTILLTNQLGYVQFNEHKKFRKDAYFSI
ncbi:MAG: metallophosphoesterase [Bacteroidales bacterium]|nr:metallophosphoesterase [Bacteroidales bacterium]